MKTQCWFYGTPADLKHTCITLRKNIYFNPFLTETTSKVEPYSPQYLLCEVINYDLKFLNFTIVIIKVIKI